MNGLQTIQMEAVNVDKMYTYLRGYLVGAQLSESLKALQFARVKHKGQYRKDGTEYISHPLAMACYAVALGIRDDNIIATILLHDVCEDCNVEIEALQFNQTIKTGVKYMTVTEFNTDKSKIETKKRYFRELLESKEALICKAIDRYYNLSDMAFTFTNDKIGKNIAETEVLLLSILKEAKEKYSELSDILFVLRTNIRSVNNILKLLCTPEYELWQKKYIEYKEE